MQKNNTNQPENLSPEVLTSEEIQSFKRFLEKKFGVAIPDEFAEEQGSRLVQAFELRLIYKRRIANSDQKSQNEVENG